MSIIEVSKLTEHVEADQLELIQKEITEHCEKEFTLDSNEDGHVIESNIDDDVFMDFRDRLEANDLNADLYVPIEFEEVFQVGDIRVASTHALELVLNSLREDFFVDDPFSSESELIEEEEEEEEEYESLDDEDEEERAGLYSMEDGAAELKDEQLRHVWKLLYAGVKESLAANLCIVLSD